MAVVVIVVVVVVVLDGDGILDFIGGVAIFMVPGRG